MAFAFTSPPRGPVVLLLGALLGCGRRTDRTDAGRIATVEKALEQAQQAAVNVAAATECALTAAATASVDRGRVLMKVNAVEVAARASAKALALARESQGRCRARWESSCDLLVDAVAVLMGATEDARERSCSR